MNLSAYAERAAKEPAKGGGREEWVEDVTLFEELLDGVYVESL